MTVRYSGDSHVVEPAQVFEGLESKLGSRAPRVEKDVNGKRGTFVVLPGMPPFAVGRFGIAGHSLDDPATHELIAQGYDGLNPGCFDSRERLKEQAVDGIVGEVMYPSLNMLTFACEERDLVHAVFERHNDWLVDYCSEAPERLVGVGCIPLPDVEPALAELQRAAAKGLRAFAIPCALTPDISYADPMFEPFWAAAEEIGAPLSMHIFTGRTLDAGLPAHWGMPPTSIIGYTLAHTSVAASMAQLICGGVLERHPNLRFVCSEFETGWLAHFLQRLDHATYRTRAQASPDLTMKPSDYWRRNFYATFEDDAAGVRTMDQIGVDNLLWGNDYPHHDSIWPNSIEVLDEILSDVSEADRQKLVADNVLDLYGIKLPADLAAGV
jgi:predicted TIM-barrel fold metal-dependent hydrolase